MSFARIVKLSDVNKEFEETGAVSLEKKRATSGERSGSAPGAEAMQSQSASDELSPKPRGHFLRYVSRCLDPCAE